VQQVEGTVLLFYHIALVAIEQLGANSIYHRLWITIFDGAVVENWSLKLWKVR